MVGVPGRSKGCKGCRRRKKACSLNRPICDLCKRLGEECDYDRDTIFVSVGETTWKQATYSTARKDAKPPQAAMIHLRGQVSPLQNGQLVQARSREQLLGKYLDINGTSTRPTLATWLRMIPSMKDPGKALETSAYAICTSRLGQLYNDPVLKHESLRLYTMGVRQLHSALKDPKRVYGDETLGACVALALYEILEGERDTYAKHTDGAAQLIKFRGPQRHRSGLGHRIFLGYRFMGTLRAMEKKEMTFLADEEWINIPWESSRKSSFDKLLDITMQAPELMMRGDDIETLSIDRQFEAGANLFRDCSKLFNQIQEFYATTSSKHGEDSYWPVLSDEKVVVQYDFVNEDTAATLIMIWAYSLMIRGGLISLSGMLKHFQQTGNVGVGENFEIQEGEDLGELARNVLLSVDYCIRSSAVEMRSPMIMAPLAIVIDVLRHWPQHQEQYLQARNALQSISKLGFKMVWPPVGEI